MRVRAGADACEGMLAWHVREGHYGDVRLDGLNLLALAAFEGNVWAGEAKVRMGLFIDERADGRQREALQTIFAGQAGGWPATFAALVGEFRGVEFVPIAFEVADDLAFWQAEIPGRVTGRAEALTGPTTPPGQRVQMINPPGSEVGPKCERKASASNGPAKAAPASISRSIGRGLVPPECKEEALVRGRPGRR
jgi:hypothetical protein